MKVSCAAFVTCLALATSGQALAAPGLTVTVTHNDPTVGNYSFVNTNDGFSYYGTYGNSVASYFGADAAGAALADSSAINGVTIDETGFIKIASLGEYAFTLNADNSGSVTIDGTTFSAPDYRTPGSGTLNLSAGYHSFDLSTFAGGAPNSLSFTVTGPAAVTYATSQDEVSSAVPEAATWAMMIAGVGMAGFAMRRRQQASVRFA